MNKARIFTILSFERHEGSRHCFVHHVAASSSHEAEKLAAEHIPDLLQNAEELYVLTDARTPDQSAAVAAYVSGSYSLRDPHTPICDEQHKGWLRAMTRDYCVAGERYPAAFRRFYVSVAESA